MAPNWATEFGSLPCARATCLDVRCWVLKGMPITACLPSCENGGSFGLCAQNLLRGVSLFRVAPGAEEPI